MSHRPDRAAFFGIYRHIILPLLVPGFAVVLIWQFTNIWNELLFAIIPPGCVAGHRRAQQPGRQPDGGMERADGGRPALGVPTLLVRIVLGRFFLRGLMAGALKG